MAAGLFFILVLGVVALLVLAVVAAVYLGSRGSRLTSSERAELHELRGLMHRLDKLAFASREIAPELSIQISDEIARSKNGELP